MRHLILLSALLTSTAHAQLDCMGNLFVNGDLNGIEGGNTTADSWEPTESPDLNDENGPLLIPSSYVWYEQPIASPNGGTWQNIYPTEAVAQEVPTVPSTAYSICLYYAQQPIIATSGTPLHDDPFGVIVYANNVQIFSTPLTSDSYIWQFACGGFVAASTSSTIKFRCAGTGGTYGAIDGLCMQVDHTNGVQEALGDAAHLFPNPAAEYLQVSGARAVSRATITNSAGQSMLAEVNGNSIGLRGLEPGLYSVQCWFASGGAPLTQRVVVE